MSRSFMFKFQSFRASSSGLEEKKQDGKEVLECAKDDILTIVKEEEWYEQPLAVLVMGASGDLAKKKTYPALFELWEEKLLPDSTIIYGFARTAHTHEELRKHIRPYLIRYCFDSNPDEAQEQAVDRFLNICFYRNGKSYGDSNTIEEILNECKPLVNLLAYLAIPPHVFGESTLALKKVLGKVNVPGFSRVILEKPFGRDTESCRELLDTLKSQEWDEKDLYRIDHYLGKEIVQNIFAMRQQNPWMESLWNKNIIESIHLIFKEPFGTEGRGGYFDPYGIIRDILQNHLLQMLTLITMELPKTEKFTADMIRDAKVDVLKKISVLQPSDCLLGQYDGYKDDSTIENRDTNTPTYACIRLNFESGPWEGVPVILEAGKALDERICEARMHIRGSNGSNALVFRLQPSPAVFFTTNVKMPGFSEHPVSTHFGVDYSQSGEKLPEAYTKLVLEALRGNQADFVRDDELLYSWKIFTNVLHLQEHSNEQPYTYEYGTSGPDVREEFLKAKGIGECSLPIASAL